MTDKEHIQGLYETMYWAMIAKDTVALGSVETDSLEITVDGESARMVGRSMADIFIMLTLPQSLKFMMRNAKTQKIFLRV